jgi:hypothetical protein
MKPYKTIKLTEDPDVADIQSEGRKSSVGKLPAKNHEYRPYSRSKNRKRIRRILKRKDKRRIDKIYEE